MLRRVVIGSFAGAVLAMAAFGSAGALNVATPGGHDVFALDPLATDNPASVTCGVNIAHGPACQDTSSSAVGAWEGAFNSQSGANGGADITVFP